MREEPREWLGRLSTSLLHAHLRHYTQLARAVAGGATGGSSEASRHVVPAPLRNHSVSLNEMSRCILQNGSPGGTVLLNECTMVTEHHVQM